MERKKGILLTDGDRETVSRLVRNGGEGRSFPRAVILRMKDGNFTNIEASEVAGATPRTVAETCRRYREGGLDSALNDEPRPGRPPKFDDRAKAGIVAVVCSKPPEGFDRWTLRLVKERAERDGTVESISTESVRLILEEHGLKPWRYKMWCVPRLDDEYVERMNDILDLYEKELDPAEPVVCLDEKPVALCGDARRRIPFSRGKPTRVDYEYVRNGTANVFCAVEPRTGTYVNEVTPTRKRADFASFLKKIHDLYKGARKIHLVMDNLNTHFRRSLTQAFGEAEGGRIWDRFVVHYTPKHGSWLNMAEIAVGIFTRQCLGNTRTDDIEDLRKKTLFWNRAVNEKGVVINWRFTKKKAAEKFRL